MIGAGADGPQTVRMDLVDLLRVGERGDAYYEAVAAADESVIAAVLGMVTDPDPVVRSAVVMVLPLLTHGDDPTQEIVAAALTLSRDPDDRVRDHATFVLAEQCREIDTAELREALVERLEDVDLQTRCEALVGLAYRRDPRALPHVKAALSRPDDSVWLLEMVAAGALADPALHPLVLRHQDGWDLPGGVRAADAARRLTDPAGPGDDLLDSVAELYRRRAHGTPDGEALAAAQLLGELTDLAPHRAGEFLDAVLARLEGNERAVHQLLHNSALAQDAGRDE